MNAQPLTQLTFLQKMYNDLTKWSKEQCINFILNEAIPNGIPISLIVTQIWRRHCQQVMDRRSRHIACNQNKLDSDHISKLMSGSKLGRRIAQRVTPYTTDNLSSDEDSDDEDYVYHDSDVDSVHSSGYEASDYYFSEEEDLDEKLQSLLDDEPDTPDTSEPQFLEDVLTNFRYIGKGPIDWEDKNIDYLVSEVLQKPDNCLQLLHEHLNVVGNLILTYTGVKVFNTSDNKVTKINKLTTNLGTSNSQNLIMRSQHIYRVKSLKQVCINSLLNAMYPKIYLQIVVAKCIAVPKMNQWEKSSPILVNYNIDQGNNPSFSHLSYSFPNRSSVRDNIEHRCIDPSHTLANMSQISMHGYDFCSRETFIRVSETNHDVLPKSIIIHQLDRQNTQISKRFFSKEVEAELNKNGDRKEANFVHLVRDWYEACDERDIHIYARLRSMEKFFRFLRGKVDWNDFPPPSNFIQGMPVQTYESIMQGISTRMQIFALSQTPVNQRAISTLSIKSFFSDLTHMEFSGLGCPKAVDIPRLISHVAEINHIRHDVHRGFVFNTTKQGCLPIPHS